MKPITALLLGLALVSPLSAQTLKPNPQKTLVYSVQGSYTSTFNSHGAIAAWYFYADGTLEGEWKTDRGAILIRTQGDLKIQELATGAGTQYYLVFRAQGQVVLPNGLLVPCSLMGKGQFSGRGLSGDYILLIDNDDINSDFGQFSGEVTRWN